MDGTPVPCGQSVITAKRSDLAGYAGYGYCASHSRFYWGSKLMLIVTCDGRSRPISKLGYLGARATWGKSPSGRGRLAGSCLGGRAPSVVFRRHGRRKRFA
jgi:hypothetical protein